MAVAVRIERAEGGWAGSASKAAMARAAGLRLRDHLLPRLQQLYRGQPVPYQQVEDAENNNTYNNDNFYTNNNYSNVNNNLLELPTPSSPGARVWQRWSRGLLGLNCLFLPAPRRYMAVPRSPTLTDRIDLEQAGARYRADRQDRARSTDRDCTSGGGCTEGDSGGAGTADWPPLPLVLQA